MSNTPKDWLKDRKTTTAEDLSNDVWIRIERVNRVLEKYGKGDFITNMPTLFAMYYYTVVTIMQIPEEPTGMELQRIYRDNLQNLADECLIEDEECTGMMDRFHEDCQKIADAYVAAKADDSAEFNPIAVLIRKTAEILGLPYQEIHLELANHLADFAVSYRVGDPAKKYPLKN